MDASCVWCKHYDDRKLDYFHEPEQLCYFKKKNVKRLDFCDYFADKIDMRTISTQYLPYLTNE